MSINTDDDILQDFLVEAGEIIDKLSEQLVMLEKIPRDADLLNAVFRGFHTIKGGAGFLGITALVAVCHRSEDVFNTLRQGKRYIDAELMDVVLIVLDLVKEMMDHVRAGEDPSPASDSLLTRLDDFAKPAPVTPSEPAVAVKEEAHPVLPSNATVSEDITDDEFDALLDQLHGSTAHAVPIKNTGDAAPSLATNINSDTITDDEFEALLDQLNNKSSENETKVASGILPTATLAHPMRMDEQVLQAQDAQERPCTSSVKEGDVKIPVESKSPDKPAAEHAAAPAKDVQQAETTVRVDTKRLDDIMNLVGELVLVRNRLSTLKLSMANEEVSQAVSNLDVVTTDLQNAVMKTRMQPIKKVFGRFPRVVRDLARSLNKEIALELHGEETDLDKNLVEALADPLVHLVRNAVDHGIESPEARLAAGKPREGKVILSAEQEGDHILLTIQDDGAGIDPEILRRKVVEKGLMDTDAAARLDNRGCFNLIFLPGFSTKSQISDVSGRGVGMDVVKTRISQLNGVVEIDSTLGKGSNFIIKLPLTLAIMPTLMIMLDRQIFAMPLVNVSEIFNLDAARTNTVDGQLVVIVRNKAIPLFYLKEWLVKGGSGGSRSSQGYVVVLNISTHIIACVVEQLIGQEEVVIKPLGAFLHGTKGLSGATITGNGRIALILDFPGLIESYVNH